MTNPSQPSANPYLKSVEAIVDQHGFHLTHVLGDQYHPEYSYTTGFLLRGHPELVTIGLAPRSSTGAFDDIFAALGDGIVFPVGRARANELRGTPFRLLPVPVRHWRGDDCLLLGIDRYYASRPELLLPDSVLQLVWPDDDGRFPWDPLVDWTVRRDQPLLSAGDAPERKTPLPDQIDNSSVCPCCRLEAAGLNRAGRRAAARRRRRST